MDSNSIDEPIDNQKVPINPDAGKSKHAPWNDILFLLTRYIENVIVI